jgi:anti-sigma factor RsiW
MKESGASPALSGVEPKDCPGFESLSRFLDGELGEAEASALAAHLDGCERCARLLSDAASLDPLIPLSLRQSPATACPISLSASEEHYAHLAECARCRARLRTSTAGRLYRIGAWAAAAVVLLALIAGLLRPTESLVIPHDVEAELSRPPERLPGRVAVALGDVGLDSAASPQVRRAVANGSLASGDRVTTAGGQRVKLSLEGGAEVLVNENTRLRLERAGVTLEEGELVALAPRPLEIETPSGTAALNSGELHVVSHPGLTSVSLFSGGGEFRGAEPAIALAPDQELRLKGRAATKVRRDEKRVEWADPIRNVYYVDQFESAELSPFWQISDAASRTTADGRPALLLSAPSRSRKRGAFARTTGDFPVDGGIAFELDLKPSSAAGHGRVLALLQSKEGGVSWSLSPGEESLEVHPDARGRHSRLWSARKGEPDGRWQRVKLVVTPQDVALFREGELVARRPHGLTGLDRVSLLLGSQALGRSRESFECQVGRVAVQRESLQ